VCLNLSLAKITFQPKMKPIKMISQKYIAALFKAALFFLTATVLVVYDGGITLHEKNLSGKTLELTEYMNLSDYVSQCRLVKHQVALLDFGVHGRRDDS
jgi:hypothetical protein